MVDICSIINNINKPKMKKLYYQIVALTEYLNAGIVLFSEYMEQCRLILDSAKLHFRYNRYYGSANAVFIKTIKNSLY